MVREREQKSGEKVGVNHKEYLSRVYYVLSYNQRLLSRGGISHGRSRVGFVNEILLDSMRYIIGDNGFLDDPESGPDSGLEREEYFVQIKQMQEALGDKPEVIGLSNQQKRTLHKSRIVLEWGWQVANEKKEGDLFSYAQTPIGEAFLISRLLLDPIVDKEKFKREFDEMKNNPDKLVRYIRLFEMELKDKRAGKTKK